MLWSTNECNATSKPSFWHENAKQRGDTSSSSGSAVLQVSELRLEAASSALPPAARQAAAAFSSGDGDARPGGGRKGMSFDGWQHKPLGGKANPGGGAGRPSGVMGSPRGVMGSSSPSGVIGGNCCCFGHCKSNALGALAAQHGVDKRVKVGAKRAFEGKGRSSGVRTQAGSRGCICNAIRSYQ